ASRTPARTPSASARGGGKGTRSATLIAMAVTADATTTPTTASSGSFVRLSIAFQSAWRNAEPSTRRRTPVGIAPGMLRSRPMELRTAITIVAFSLAACGGRVVVDHGASGGHGGQGGHGGMGGVPNGPGGMGGFPDGPGGFGGTMMSTG